MTIWFLILSNAFVSDSGAINNYACTTGVKWDECSPYLKGIRLDFKRNKEIEENHVLFPSLCISPSS